MDIGYNIGWVFYLVGFFIKCFQLGYLGCFDQFFVDGNLQFSDYFFS